tara:strand:- start:676 stop:1017 length:342 start_codon:yes stop_codon:yes gene_type:complete
METLEDFKRGDVYETEYQHNKADALDECIILAGELTLAVEHLITEADNTVEQRNITELHTAVKKIVDLRFYDFTATVEGKYDVTEEVIEYNFSYQLMDFLEDALGYNYEELFV